MDRENSVETEFKDYLLGQLSEAEEQRFEEQLMDDDVLFTRAEAMLDLVEDDLIEDYLKGLLTESERASFELRLLHSPKIQEKMILIRALLKKGGRRETVERSARVIDGPGSLSWLRRWKDTFIQPLPALAASLALILLGGGFWATVRIGLLEGRLAEMQDRQFLLLSSQQELRTQLTHEQGLTRSLASELEQAKTRSAALEDRVRILDDLSAPEIPSVLLFPGLSRSTGQVATVSVSSKHQLLALKLDLGLDEYPSYRAALCDAGGNEILVHSRLTAIHEGGQVIVSVQFPTGLLRSDQYLVKLAGITDAGNPEQLELFHFRLRRK